MTKKNIITHVVAFLVGALSVLGGFLSTNAAKKNIEAVQPAVDAVVAPKESPPVVPPIGG
jgi:hypothetical protein